MTPRLNVVGIWERPPITSTDRGALSLGDGSTDAREDFGATKMQAMRYLIMKPVTMDIPHSAGKTAARQRIGGGFHKLACFVPGAKITEHRWEGDSLFFAVEALGQRVAARLDVLEEKVHAEVNLPPALALFAEKIRGALADAGTKLLK